MEAAEQANVYIPHLCHHPDLPDVGECGLCIVEIEGRSEITPACITEAEEGMVIRTRTEKLETIRRLNLELMLSNHIEDCTTCPKYGNCELQSVYQYLGVSVGRLRQTLNRTPPVNTNNPPLIVRDLNRCISCTRCERICREVRGVDALRLERTPPLVACRSTSKTRACSRMPTAASAALCRSLPDWRLAGCRRSLPRRSQARTGKHPLSG